MSPRHAAPVTRRQTIAAFVLLALTAAAWSIWENFASGVAEDVGTAVGDHLSDDFPGEVDVVYGSYQATTALFPDGMPDTLPEDDDHTTWARDNGGLLAWRALACVSFTGREASVIWIDDVHVALTSSDDEPPGGLYMPPGGAGDTFDRLITIDLDDPGTPRELSSDTSATQTWDFPIWVNDAEPETPCILLETWHGDHSFHLVVDYRVGDESRSMVLDDDGEPFRLVGPARATRTLVVPYGDPTSYTITEAPPTEPVQ